MTTILQDLDEVLASSKEGNEPAYMFDIRAGDFLRNHAPKIRAALELQARVETYRFEIVQDSFPQAGGYAPVLADAEREASHYAMIYEQDGPVQVNMYAVLKAAPPAGGQDGQ